MAREVVLIAFDLRTAVSLDRRVGSHVDLREGLRRIREAGLTSICGLALARRIGGGCVLSIRSTSVAGTDGYGRIGGTGQV